MDYLDFQIRAWRADDAHVQVIVHSSPVSDMYRPVAVPFDADELSAIQSLTADHWRVGGPGATRRQMIEVGQKLARVLLPNEVNNYLLRSLDKIGPEEGLRVRLCLDEFLFQQPWEFLYRPDAGADENLGGFLVLDSRISLVRGAAVSSNSRPLSSPDLERMVFAGTLYRYEGQEDYWRVREEHSCLTGALSPLAKEALTIDPFIDTSGDNINDALGRQAGIFHYSGHVDYNSQGWYLTKEISDGAAQSFLYAEELKALLTRAQTKLAVFSACNGGDWRFVKTLVRAGIPILIGSQGAVTPGAALSFYEKLYQSLAAGLSLDEAVTWARLEVFNQGSRLDAENLEWGNFMVYLSAPDAVLFPKPAQASRIAQHQEQVRAERAQTVKDVTETLGKPAAGAEPPVSNRALRNAINARFDLDELELLCADLKQNLADDGIHLQLSLDELDDGPKENKILSLIGKLERHQCLPYLISLVRTSRPGSI